MHVIRNFRCYGYSRKPHNDRKISKARVGYQWYKPCNSFDNNKSTIAIVLNSKENIKEFFYYVSIDTMLVATQNWTHHQNRRKFAKSLSGASITWTILVEREVWIWGSELQ